MTPIPPPLNPDDGAFLLSRYWQGREDFHALQNPKGGYLGNVPGGISLPLLKQHTRAEITVGQYQINTLNQVWWTCVEVEDHADEPDLSLVHERLRTVLDCFDEMRLRYVVEESSPGNFHVWLLLSQPVPTQLAYDFGQRFKVMAFGKEHNQYEWFPKQHSLGTSKGLGNLVRIPLGMHQVKRVWSKIYDLAEQLPTNTPMALMAAYKSIESRYGVALTAAYTPRPTVNVTDRPPVRGGSYNSASVDREKYVETAITIEELVGQIMREAGYPIGEIRPGSTIPCPFHSKGDNGSTGIPSFMVGGRISKDVCKCWSTNCKLGGKWLNRRQFVQEFFGIEDREQGLIRLEEYAGIR